MNTLLKIKLLFIISLPAFSQSTDHDWTLAYDDPIELSKEIINNSKELWHPPFKNLIFFEYKAILPFTDHVGKYIFYEAPSLTVAYLRSGRYGVAEALTKDILLEILLNSINEPKKECKKYVKATINQGLVEYSKAFNIAQKFKNDKSITREEAIEFLDNRWGFYKLRIARTLYLEIEEDIVEHLSTSIVQDASEEIIKKLSLYDSGELIKTIEAALTVYQITELLKERKVGIMDYPPYLNFMENMTYLNKLRLEESERWKTSIAIVDPNNESKWESSSSVNISWETKGIDEQSMIGFVLAKGNTEIERFGPFKNDGELSGFRLNNILVPGNDYKLYAFEYTPTDYNNIANYETEYFSVIDTEENPEEDFFPVRKNFAGRKIKYIREITVRSEEVIIELWDHGKEDGDIVSIHVNAEPIVSSYYLKKNRKSLKVKLENERLNDLFLFAHNVGEIPPNTVSITINDGYSSENFTLNSDLSSCEAVLIKVEK